MCCGNTQTTVSAPEVPEWLENFYKRQTAAASELYDTARDIYRQRVDFPLYTEPRLQQLTPDQVASFDLIRRNVGIGDPALEAATARATQAGRTFADMGGTPYTAEQNIGIEGLTAANLAPYRSIYEDDVVDATLADMQEEFQRQGLARQGAATRAGAFGGSRHGLQDALAQERYNRAVGRVGADIRDRGFGRALSARQADLEAGLRGDIAQEQADRAAAAMNRATFQADQGRMLSSAQVAAGLGQQQQQQLFRDAAALQAQGAQQQAFGQQGLDLAYGDFQAQTAYPYAQLGFLQSAIQQAPFNPAVFTGQTTTSPGPSTLGQIAGLGIAGLGALSGGPGIAANAAGIAGLFCWVAREVYGEENVRWVLFRKWLLHASPRWFRNLYMLHGEDFAKWLRDKPRIKSLIRKWMDRIIDKHNKEVLV